VPGAHHWQIEIDREHVPFPGVQRVGGTPLLPFTSYAQMAMAAARKAFEADHLVSGLQLHQPLVVPGDGRRVVQVSLTAKSAMGVAQFSVHSRPLGAADAAKRWTLHATARVQPA
jgi:Polyketide synthase dehydratase